MAEVRAKVLLSHDVHKQIMWLTHNMDTEIAAVGTVEVREDEEGYKYFYVEELMYPQQTVGVATVHIESSGWGPLLKKHGLEKMSKVGFYWHRHPGSSGHSQTDEEDTFGTLMQKDSPYFIFLQTAVSGGKLNYELRVEIGDPVRATLIGDTTTQLMYEPSPDEIEFSKMMESIIEEAVIVEKPKPRKQLKYKRNSTTKKSTKNNVDSDIEALKLLFESDKKKTYIDNDDIASDMQKASVTFQHGGAFIKTKPEFDKVMKNALSKNGMLDDVVGRYSSEIEKGWKIYKIQPQKNGYDDMVTKIKQLFVSYNEALLSKSLDSDLESKVKKVTVNTDYVIEDEHALAVIQELEKDFVVEWTNTTSDIKEATVYDSEAKEIKLGTLSYGKKSETGIFLGYELAEIAEEIHLDVKAGVKEDDTELVEAE